MDVVDEASSSRMEYSKPSPHLYSFLINRDIGLGYRRPLYARSPFSESLREISSVRVPFALRKPIVQFPAPKGFCDKVFAGCWLDDSTVFMGTKDNQLIRWDVQSRKFHSIPLPESDSPRPSDSCGIHDVGINPSRTLLFSGGSCSSEIQLFSTASMEPLMLLRGHTDWIFAAKFISDNVIVSGSRDTTVNVWKLGDDDVGMLVDDGQQQPWRNPSQIFYEHTKKVRDVQFSAWSKQFYTLSFDETVKIWDSIDLQVLRTIPLSVKNELVCMASHDNSSLVAVGSQRCVTILDPRCQDDSVEINTIPSKDREWGTRSVRFNNHIVSIGGGMGSLSFYDLRSNNFLRVGSERDPHADDDDRAEINMNDEPSDEEFKSGQGWMERDTSFYNVVGLLDIKHAIYSHCYDPSGTKLFVAGGPIMLGLKGSYAAIW